MTNQDIASIFRHEADRMALEGNNPFRIRAYRRAADALEQLSEPARAMADRRQLRQIPGIGGEFEKKVHSLLDSGRLPEPGRSPVSHESEESARSTVAGLNEQTAALLARRYGIKHPEDLEALARSRLLRTLPGIGRDIERAILRHSSDGEKNPSHTPNSLDL